MKKILVSLLCAVMVVTFMPSMAFAADLQMPSDAENNQPQAEEGGGEQGGTAGTENGASGGVVVLTQGEQSLGTYNSVERAIEEIKDYDYSTNKEEYVIKLQKNIQEDIVIPVKKKIAIDLNGHKITNVSSHTIYNNSTNIRVIDTAGGGIVDNVTNGKAAVYNNIKSNIKLAGGTFTRSQEASTGDSASGNNSFYVVKNFGTMTVYDGVTVKFSDQNPGLYSSLIGNGWQDAAAAEAGTNGEPKPSLASRKAAVLGIQGGKLIGGQITVKNDDYGELTVSGGEIVQPSEGRAAIANNHKAKIKGGTIEARGINGQAVYSRYFETGANKGELEITGGTFKSAATVIQAQEGSTLNVTAGTFETSNKESYIFDISENVKSTIKSGTYIGVTADKVANRTDAFVEGYGPQADVNGNIIVDVTEAGTVATVIDRNNNIVRYASLDSALGKASAGSTVKLHKNITLEKGVSTSNQPGITFDLNGYSIDGTNVKPGNSVVNMTVNYGWKPVEGIESTMRVINSKTTGGEIKGTTPVRFNSGDSSYQIAGEIGENVKLVTLDKDADAVKLGSAAYLVYSDTTKDYIKNGGFKSTGLNGKSYIYGSYSSATEKAADGVVTLLHNYIGTDKIYSGSKSAVLDLAGNIYEYTGKDNVIIDVNYPNVELTIRNGKILTTNESCDGAHLIGAPNASNMNNRGLVLEKVELTVPGEVYGIVTNGKETGNKVVLKDSILNVENGYGIYFPSTGNVEIDNSVINAKYTGIQMCAGNLTVKGDKTAITVTGQPQEKEGGDGPIADGAAISIIEREGYKDLGSVKIENGTFKSADEVKSVKAYTFNNTDKKEGEWPEAKDVVSVTGGTFSKVDGVADFIPSGMELNESGTVVTKADAEAKIGTAVYKTLEDAVAAAKNGETIILLNSVNLDHQLNITKSITLDGDGNTLKVRIADIDKISAGERAAVFVDGAGVEVTIKDITIDGPCENTSAWISGAHTLKVWGGAKVTLSNAMLTHGVEALQVGKNSEAVLDGKINFTQNMYDGIELIDGGDADTIIGDAKLTVNKGTEFVNKDTIIWKDTPESSGEKLPVQENITDNSGNLQFDKDGNLTDVEKPYVPPYIPPTPQKPTIEAEEGATVTLSKDGTTATIVVDKDATLKDVLLNGKSLGAVTEVPNLKTGDKLVVIVETAEEKAERLTKGVENTTIKLYYKKGEIGKGWIKLRYKKSYGYKVDNYEIFRSAKKKTGFGKKAWFVTKTNKTKGFYKNGKSVKKGTRYYYKMRGVREIDGKKVYTKWSNIVMRTGR